MKDDSEKSQCQNRPSKALTDPVTWSSLAAVDVFSSIFSEGPACLACERVFPRNVGENTPGRFSISAIPKQHLLDYSSRITRFPSFPNKIH